MPGFTSSSYSSYEQRARCSVDALQRNRLRSAIRRGRCCEHIYVPT